MKVLWPSKILKPTQVLSKTTDGPRVLFPGKHGLISGEGMISENFTCAFNFRPINRPLFKPLNIVVTIM